MPYYYNLSSYSTTSGTTQQLAIAPTITVSYTCNGQKTSTTFSGYPSITSRDAAAQIWLWEMADKCKFGTNHLRRW